MPSTDNWEPRSNLGELEMIKRTCLIVDDSKVIRTVARKMLTHLDFATDEAASGEAALARCRESMPDAILFDAHMAEMSGGNFMQRLRVLPDGDKPVVVVATNDLEADDVDEALCEGADDCIMKPLDDASMRRKFSGIGLFRPQVSRWFARTADSESSDFEVVYP